MALWNRVRNIVRESDSIRDIDEELRSHVDEAIGDGRTPAEASKALGSKLRIREEVRDAMIVAWLDRLKHDVRYALRVLRRSPGFTATAVVSLALGIGANTALFSVVHALLLKDLPYRDGDRLAYVTEYWPHEPFNPGPPSPDYYNWRENSKLVEAMEGYAGVGFNLTLTGFGDAERIPGTLVTSGLLDMLGVRMAAGRNFTADEDLPNAEPVVILSHRLWLRRFGGSLDVIGKSFTFDGVGRRVIGVLPADFLIPDNNFKDDLLVPMGLRPHQAWRAADPNSFRTMRVMAKLKPGASREAAKDELVSIVRSTANEEPTQFVTMRRDMEVRVVPLRDWLTGDVRTSLIVLQSAVVLVLLIACLNVAGLQTTRAIARSREIALRLALGASRSQIVRQLLAESAILSAAAAICGVALAYAGLSVVRSYLPANLHLAATIRVDLTVLAGALAAAVAAALITGVAPALMASRRSLNEALKESSRSTESSGRQWLHRGLVAAQVALAMVLLSASGVLIRAFLDKALADPGFDPHGVFTMRMSLPGPGVPTAEQSGRFYTELLTKLESIPGVQAAAVGGGLPLMGTVGASGTSFEGKPQPALGGRPTLPTAAVSDGYFKALGIRLARGRLFEAQDHGGPLVAVVNQAFADEFYRGEEILGRRIEVGSRTGRWREIVGVVANVRQPNKRPTDPFQIYLPIQDSFGSEAFVALKSDLPPSSLRNAAAAAVHTLNANQPVFDVATMDERLSDSLSGPRANMTLMSAFAGLALVLAAVGLFGVIAYYVGQRVNELGVRMAVGATRGAVVGMVLRRGLTLTAIGLVGGISAAIATARALGTLVAGVRTNDPPVLAAAAITFAVVAGLACLIPASRAARIDPAQALRHD